MSMIFFIIKWSAFWSNFGNFVSKDGSWWLDKILGSFDYQSTCQSLVNKWYFSHFDS